MEMLADDDPKKLRAALEQLEAEQARRIQLKIEAGALINVPLEVVVGDEAEAAASIERAKAQALLDLQAKGDTRAAHFDVRVIVTGVPSGPGHYESSSDAPTLRADRYPAEDAPRYVSSEAEREAASVYLAPDQPEVYVSAVTRPPSSEDDPGVIAYGWFSVKNGNLILLDGKRRHLTTRRLREGEEPATVARQALQANAGNGFNRPLEYPNLSVA
jgi:hypothetical protein